MSDSTKNEIIYRCPTCLNGGTDMYLVQEGDSYRCLKCSFTGKAEEITERYNEFRKRYRLMNNRINLDEQRKM